MKLPEVPSKGFLKALPEEERRRLGYGEPTTESADTVVRRRRYGAGEERDLQDDVAKWLDDHGHYNESDRMDKPTSGRKGRADFRCCIHGKWLSIECKTEVGTITPAQAREAARLRRSRGAFVIAYCVQDVEAAVRELTAG